MSHESFRSFDSINESPKIEWDPVAMDLEFRGETDNLKSKCIRDFERVMVLRRRVKRGEGLEREAGGDLLL